MRFARSFIGCLLILLLACSMSAWAQCNTSYLAPLDQFPGPGLRNCNQFPRSPIVPAGPVMVTYSGGDTLNIFGSTFYQTLDLQGYLGCANGFGTEIKVNFSQPVANVSFSLFNGAFNEATAFSITDDAGDSQQVTLLGTNGGGSQTQTFVVLPGTNIQQVSIKALPAPNTLYNFMISAVRFNLLTQPGSGTITVNPSSAAAGTTLMVSGNGWTAKSPGSGYKTLFDGVQVAQQGVFACTTQPLMSFDVPCAATTGTHTITVQLTDNNTGQVIASQDMSFEVTRPTIASLATNCQSLAITSISPAMLLVSTNPRIVITGIGFSNNAFINFLNLTGNEISVRRYISRSANRIEAELRIMKTAQGPYGITITSLGQTSNSLGVWVQVPTRLKVISAVALPLQCPGCGCAQARNFGIECAITYQVVDQLGDPIKSNMMIPQETITNLIVNRVAQGDPVPNPADIGPTMYRGTARNTDMNGRFLDAPIGSCAGQNLLTTSTQQISVLIGNDRYILKTNNLTVRSTAIGTGLLTNGSDIKVTRP